MNATERQIHLHSFHSDVYKDVHGIRPRWLRPANHTEAEWESLIEELLKEGHDPAGDWSDTSSELR